VHAVPDLEAMLPSVAGTTLTIQSKLGRSGLGDDQATADALSAQLAKVGKTAADWQAAEGYDDSGVTDLAVFAYRVSGLKGPALGKVVVDGFVAASAGATTAMATIGGKQVTHVMYGAGGLDDYVFVKGDVVFDVATADPALASQALAAIP
jgi:hypothetical protein